MILVLLGMNEKHFDRAVDCVLPLAEREEVVIQHGHTRRREVDNAVMWLSFIDYDKVIELCRQARAVVCHAGVGSIMTVRGVGKTPVVLPRLAKYGEAVDDHQLQLADEFARRRLAVVARDATDIQTAIDAAAEIPAERAADGSLLEAVAEAVG